MIIYNMYKNKRARIQPWQMQVLGVISIKKNVIKGQYWGHVLIGLYHIISYHMHFRMVNGILYYNSFILSMNYIGLHSTESNLKIYLDYNKPGNSTFVYQTMYYRVSDIDGESV